MKKFNKIIKIISIKTKSLFKNKLLVGVVAIFVVLITLGITFSRYIYNIYHNYILESQGFYFNSSVMTVNGSNHSINNWDGVNGYSITIDVNNKKNDLVYTSSDISYDITYECSDNITCTVSQESGVIRSGTNVDSYTITFYPNGNFTENQTAVVKTSAKSTYPYVKELSTTYNIGIEISSFSYSISDSTNEKYLTIELTNAYTYYRVEEAFGDYSVGDNISVEDYESLSDSEKENCYSAIVTLSFDPNVILLDMTDNNYLNSVSSTTEVINDYDYVNKFTFKMDASTSEKIVFYKLDSAEDYTYPGTDDPVITVSVVGVDDE